MAKHSEISQSIVIAIGHEAATKFFKVYGGKQIRMPLGSGKAGPFTARLIDLMGEAAANKLIRNFAGEEFTVPKGHCQALIARNRLIVADYEAGMNLLGLVGKYNLTERQLRTILNRPSE